MPLCSIGGHVPQTGAACVRFRCKHWPHGYGPRGRPLRIRRYRPRRYLGAQKKTCPCANCLQGASSIRTREPSICVSDTAWLSMQAPPVQNDVARVRCGAASRRERRLVVPKSHLFAASACWVEPAHPTRANNCRTGTTGPASAQIVATWVRFFDGTQVSVTPIPAVFQGAFCNVVPMRHLSAAESHTCAICLRWAAPNRAHAAFVRTAQRPSAQESHLPALRRPQPRPRGAYRSTQPFPSAASLLHQQCVPSCARPLTAQAVPRLLTLKYTI